MEIASRRPTLVCLLLLFVLVSASAIEGNTKICASPISDHGNRAVGCGASNPDRPASCCSGYVCRGNGAVTCMAAPSSDKEEDDEEDITISSIAVDSNSLATDGGETTESTTDTGSSNILPGNHEICGGWRDKAVACGDPNLEKAARCCPGYKCSPEKDKTTCVAADKRFEPLKEADPFVQKRPIEVNDKITIVGTNFAAAGDSKVLGVSVPRQATKGDMLLLFIGGSAGSKRPEAPKKWNLIEEEGKADLNIMALYRWYDKGDDDKLSIAGGKNTFAIISSLQGVDKKKPIVDSVAVRESAPGKDGRAKAPSAFSIEKGAAVAAFVYDDPQVAQLLTDGFDTLATSDTGTGDGMAAFVASTDLTGFSEAVSVAGSPQSGGGNDVTMTVTLRPNGGPYDEPPEQEPEPEPLEVPAQEDVNVEEYIYPTTSPISVRPTNYPTASRQLPPTAAPTEVPPNKAPTNSVPLLKDPGANIDPSIAYLKESTSAASCSNGEYVLVVTILSIFSLLVPLF